MRLQIYSDLHLECFPEGRDLNTDEADIIILAGDIHNGTQGLTWARKQFPHNPIIYVPGNHEFYGSHLSDLRYQLQICAQKLDIHLLDNGEKIIDGVRFLGTTLWTDFQLYQENEDYPTEVIKAQAAERIPDFRNILQNPGELFSVDESIRLHHHCREWLQIALAGKFDGKTVVISHHAPLEQCIPLQYQGDMLSPAFASDLYSMMGQMSLWIHGHVHEAVDITCRGTRVVANPGGYPIEVAAGQACGRALNIEI